MAAAQTTRGAFTGRVTDPSSASVSGAKVHLVNRATGAAQDAITGADGTYSLTNVDAGTYDLSVTSPGFSTTTLQGVVLDIQQTVREDVALQVGATSSAITVDTATPIIQTESATLNDVVDGKQIQDTPLNGRGNAYQLMGLAPGVQRPNSNALIAGSSFQGGTTQTIDGITNNDIFNARMNGNIISLEAIAEFTVIYNTPPAEFGRGGAQIVIATKSGSNLFHGSLFEFNRNRYFAARNYFNQAPTAKPVFNRNEFGGSIGGYIWRDKLFFFGSYEQLLRVQPTTVTMIQPPTAFLSGDFPQFKTANNNSSIIYDPSTGQPFPNNIIPDGRISPTSRKFLQLYSAPNTQGSNPLATNFTYSSPTYEVNPRYSIRADWQMNPRDRIMFRFYRNDDGPYLSNSGGSDKFGNYAGTGTRTRQYMGSWVHLFGNGAVNEFLGGFNQEADPRTDQNFAVNPASLVPGIPTPPAGHGGVPTVAINGINSINSAGSNYDNHQHVIQVNDNLALVKGGHTLKVGAQFLSQEGGQGSLNFGSFSFDGRYTGHYKANGFATTQAVNPVNAFADFLLGYMTSSSTVNNNNHYDGFAKMYALYAQDNWTVDPKLTLNLGLRYEKTFPMTRSLGGISNFYPDLNKLVTVTGTPDPTLLAKYPVVAGNTVGIDAGNYTSTQNFNFSPRVGFAYRPFSGNGFVVRGGFALVYNYLSQYINGLNGQPPFITNITYSATAGTTPSLNFSNPFPSNLGSIPANPSLSAVPRNIHTPYNEQWNLTVEKEILRNTGLRVSYVGNAGHHLYQPFNLNDPPPTVVPAGHQLQEYRPYQPWGAISLLSWDTDSTTNQLQVGLRRRFSDLTVSAQYQYTRALGIDGANDGAPSDNRNIAYDYGNLDFYVRHYLVTNYSYTLPFGKGKWLFGNASGLIDRLVSGWRAAGVVTTYSGTPFSVSFTSTVTGWPSGRADRIAGVPLYPQHRTIQNWYNTAAFKAPSPYLFGTSQRNLLFGPAYASWDASFQKTTKIHDRLAFEFRADAFNVLNHPNFGVPARNISTPATNGVISSASDGRQLQFGARLQF